MTNQHGTRKITAADKWQTAETMKPRFKIEKLEERIAPHHRIDHVHGPGIHPCRPRGCER